MLVNQVSWDLEDLEEYLETGDEKILWNHQEDEDLLNKNATALRYLKILKGEARMKRRREFLERQW